MQEYGSAHMDYCDIIYNSAMKDQLNKLQLVQNTACRTILLCDRDAHIEDMHIELGLLKLYTRRQLHLATTCHKAIHSMGKIV